MSPDNIDSTPNHSRLSWRETQRNFRMTKSRLRRTTQRLRAQGKQVTMAEFIERYAKGEQI